MESISIEKIPQRETLKSFDNRLQIETMKLMEKKVFSPFESGFDKYRKMGFDERKKCYEFFTNYHFNVFMDDTPQQLCDKAIKTMMENDNQRKRNQNFSEKSKIARKKSVTFVSPDQFSRDKTILFKKTDERWSDA